jgi:hypothetical protein
MQRLTMALAATERSSADIEIAHAESTSGVPAPSPCGPHAEEAGMDTPRPPHHSSGRPRRGRRPDPPGPAPVVAPRLSRPGWPRLSPGSTHCSGATPSPSPSAGRCRRPPAHGAGHSPGASRSPPARTLLRTAIALDALSLVASLAASHTTEATRLVLSRARPSRLSSCSL